MVPTAEYEFLIVFQAEQVEGAADVPKPPLVPGVLYKRVTAARSRLNEHRLPAQVPLFFMQNQGGA